jgi:hypothetical protein
MTRLCIASVLAVCLVSCGDDGTTDCGPNPCGLCSPGCTNTDTCEMGGWSCSCVCPDSGSGDASMDATPDGTTDATLDSSPGDAPADATADTMNPSGCPPDGMGMCEPMGLVCRYGDRVCTCEPPCSGVDPGPDPPTNWACATRPLACPEAVPTDGDPCRTNGLTCAYGTCGGSTATCVSGTWSVMFIPPPP